MNPHIADLLENLRPAKVVVFLFLLDVALVIIHGFFPFDDIRYALLFYSIAAGALLAFLWHCAVAIQVLRKWQKEKAAASPSP